MWYWPCKIDGSVPVKNTDFNYTHPLIFEMVANEFLCLLKLIQYDNGWYFLHDMNKTGT